jgi:hypothetical protein
MEIFPFDNMRKKKVGNKNRVKGRFLYILMRSSEVWEQPWAHALSSTPPSGERTCIGTSPTTKS